MFYCFQSETNVALFNVDFNVMLQSFLVVLLSHQLSSLLNELLDDDYAADK